ncbi:spore coat protein U domain-containing protein [Myxococcus llanfairpwllgwyngyllgogerychwyrndrobwllllantysiliogogogochensis]|uniref:Spore coat protein U domain-containing protein n=1 Tax=Myxococcus llanfairpwllgwyngyllgogerychwyrndrobwllllantysiliogogogochensis TaxID=2590453 RepID=A0A540WVJ6_9BACT|nr:spore coat U domain-containing protein [Myxococcus llanfairpwllgwyngyllgogerychwyrndrobwllllantysiliogogogochensis]TQF13026.1 spore coat protein U domain-containing protein [Myxococcus llanfairpwllgwyngyllgogerychwyrndrobwllllantysiliogogogochensis]
MRMRGDLALMLAGLCGLTSASARAVCEIRNVVGLRFLNYTPTATLPLDATGSITMRCTGPQLTPVTIDLSQGGSNNYALRRMQGPSSSTLAYNLYLDATRLLIWGNGLSGTSRYGPILPVLGLEITLPIHGRVPAQQSVAAGSYSDTLVVTLTF